jgi:1A family penicillin-binding protein
MLPRLQPILLRLQPKNLAIAASAAVLSLALVGGFAWRNLVRDLPGRDALNHIGETAQATLVYDGSDHGVSTIFNQQRIDVPLENVSTYFTQALISVEDQRFYEHGAIDPRRIFSAALADVARRRAAQGASTLTQQLARASFLTPRRTLRRKLQEIVLASRIERQYSKHDILELYVNRVYFGNGLWGIEAASLGYFGKHASDLTLPEAALLAGLVKSPSTLAPTTDLERATRRRNVVLQTMLEANLIDRPTWERARKARVTLHDALSSAGVHGAYFFEEVRRALVDRFDIDRVYSGGLRVYSTIDPVMQAAADEAVRASLAELDAQGRPSKDPASREGERLQAALIAIDPSTGYIRALVGGRDFAASPFDRAMQAHRQPGSAFKPFVYAAALEAGYTQTSVLDHLDEPIATPRGNWLPDDGHAGEPSLDLRNALRISSNRAAIRLLQQVGIPRVVTLANTLGLEKQPAVPSLALGSGSVTLASLTAAYAAFANGGILRPPTLIRRVDDDNGQVLFTSKDEAAKVLSETTAFLMSDMLTDVINAGTASKARSLGFTLPAAGKTGTTNSFNDAWFVGYTPRLVVGVWVGFDAPRTIGRNAFAATVAVPMWTRFMSAATRGDSPQWLAPPAGVVSAAICPVSGKLATGNCETQRSRYFATGTEPIEYCDVHRPSFFKRILGLSAERAPQQPPPTVDYEPGPAANAAAAGDPANPQASTPGNPAPKPPVKKRGFWSRIFH